jgi:cobalt-zinc-cadmium efflux system protein
MSHDHAGHRHGSGHAGGHAHDRDPERRAGAHGAGQSVRRLAASLALTALVMVAEAVGGWISGSLALLSDAAHMLTDAGALGLAVVAALLAARPADDKRTFGYRRAEVLGAQLNVGALVGLAANLAILWFLHREHSLNARSAFLHVVSDTISSVAILLGAGAMALRPELWWIDPLLSIGISVLILWGAWRLVLEVTDILMEAVPGHIDAAEVARQMEETEFVLAVHDLHIWSISSGMCALSAHLVVDGVAVGRNDEILTEVKARLRRSFGIDHTTLQIESAAYAHVDDVHTH